MITCLGLIAGIVETPYPQDLVNTCAKFLKMYKMDEFSNFKYNPSSRPIFEIEGVPYCVALDGFYEDDKINVLFRILTGSHEDEWFVGIA